MKKILLATVLAGGLFAGGFYDEPDKKKHFEVGAGIGAVANTYYQIQGDNVFYSTVKGIVWSALAGVLKESWDKHIKKTRFDNADLRATIAGGAAGSVGTSVLYIPFRIAFGIDTKKNDNRLYKMKSAALLLVKNQKGNK